MDRRARYQSHRSTLGQVSAGLMAQAARVTLEPTAGDVKAQGVRLADIFIFGPLMLYAGMGKDTPQWVKVGMLLLGGGTIIYNLVNFFEVARREGDQLSGMTSGPVDQARAESLKRQLDAAGVS